MFVNTLIWIKTNVTLGHCEGVLKCRCPMYSEMLERRMEKEKVGKHWKER